MKGGRRKKAGWIMFVLAVSLLAGCGDSDGSGTGTLVSPDETYEKASAQDYTLRDKDSLYKEEYDSEVTTMYLTVGQGNADDGTNHTWKEVNTYSVDYYEENNMQPYMCEAVLQAGDEEGPLKGEFGYGELAANATVRLRGSGASARQQKSYRIDIKDGKGKWEGQKTVILNKDFSDPTRFHNKLAYSLMQDVDQIISVRTSFVHLYVKDKTEGENGLFQDYGLYTQVEQINKTYLKNHDFDNGGQLYKAEDFDWGRHEDSIVLATDSNFDAQLFEQYLEIKGSDDHTKLIDLLTAVNDDTIPIGEVIDKYFDQDNLYYWMAFQILTGNKEDGTGNYYLYSPSMMEKWYIISWDNDGAFSEAYKRMQDESYESSWNAGIFTYTDAALFSRLLKDKECRNMLDQAVEDLKQDYLTADRINEKAQAYKALVKPYLYSLPDRMYARVSEADYELLADGLAGEVEDNYRAYKESLGQPWPFHILEPQIRGSQLNLRWEASWVFGGDVTYTVELSDTYSFADPLVSETNVSETSLAVDSLAPGQYFVRVRADSGSGYSQDAYEYYRTEQGTTVYSVQCFYVLEDGSIAVSYYYEDE